MEPMELIFLYIVPVALVIESLIIGIVWAMMPNIAKKFTLKKLGFLKNKAFDLDAWDDRVVQLEVHDVAPEGMLESRGKKGKMGRSFYLAKPLTDTKNTADNLLSSNRDLDILPPYTIDGIPVFFSHVAKAVATNPAVITSLRLGNQQEIDPVKPSLLKRMIHVKPFENSKTGKTEDLFEVTVKLPFDPVDIKKSFPLYWQQSNIDSTKRRSEQIGIEKAKRNQSSDWWKGIVLLGIIACIIVGLVGYFSNNHPAPAVTQPVQTVAPAIVAKLFGG